MVSGKKTDMSNGTTKYRDQTTNMSFNRKDVSGSNKAQNGNASSFRTDTAISGGRTQGERELVPWIPDSTEQTDGSLESGRVRGAGGAQWDQFAENERKFGIKTDYREDIYTTTINKNHPQYKQRLADADRKAREIERSSATNSHVAEERIKDNLTTGDNGDEEDKYSGVRRQNDFPPLVPSNNSNKYTPPARRAPTGQSTVSGAPVDPAIISSQLAKPSVDKNKTASTTPKVNKPEVVSQPTTTAESTPVAPSESKTTTSTAPVPVSRTASPQVRTEGTPNATATVERDVASAFKHFASKERKNVDQIRSAKARNDKEIKLNDLKKFADSFKLLTPVPSDLVSIIAKDPAKQKEIQEKAKRNAEEAKANPPENVKATTPASDAKPTQRPVTTAHSASASASTNRQVPNARNQGFQPQFAQQSYQNSRAQGQQGMPQPHRQPSGNPNNRLKNVEQAKPGQAQMNPIPSFNYDRQIPTGPSSQVDPNFSRRSSGVASQGRSFNVNAKDFQPNVNAPSFSPSVNPSSGSSPRSAVNHVEQTTTPLVSRSLLRRKPIPLTERPDISKAFNVMENLKSLKAPPGKEAAWKSTGGLKPAYDTPPVWRTVQDNDAPESTIHMTYTEFFAKTAFPPQTMSPPNPGHAIPQVPHQHQLPFHLQQNVHNMVPRGSPRQPQMNMHGNQHLQGPNQSFNGSDDHRMMPSHSAQSFASPRLPNAPMAFPSPMNQSAQLYNPQMVYHGAPPMQPQFRSLSQSHQFGPQQTHMGGPMMIPNSNGYMTTPGMPPQMMYGQGPFMQPGNGPPAMPGVNGYPSPGRGAPMMMNQGSQQGHQQPMYGMVQGMNPGMSPGPQFANTGPIYAQQPPGQQMPMRGFQGPGQFGTSPQQAHQFQPQQHRNNSHSNGNYNKNFPHQGQHPNGPPNNQAPAAPQARVAEGNDESK